MKIDPPKIILDSNYNTIFGLKINKYINFLYFLLFIFKVYKLQNFVVRQTNRHCDEIYKVPFYFLNGTQTITKRRLFGFETPNIASNKADLINVCIKFDRN